MHTLRETLCCADYTHSKTSRHITRVRVYRREVTVRPCNRRLCWRRLCGVADLLVEHLHARCRGAFEQVQMCRTVAVRSTIPSMVVENKFSFSFASCALQS